MLGDYDDDDRMRPTASRRDTLAVPVLIAACVFVGFTACFAVLTACAVYWWWLFGLVFGTMGEAA